MASRSSSIPLIFYVMGVFCIQSHEILTVSKATGGSTKFAQYHSEARADIANPSTMNTDEADKRFIPITMRMYLGREDPFEADTVLFVFGRAAFSSGTPDDRSLILDPIFHCKLGSGSPSTNDDYFDTVPSLGATMAFIAGLSTQPLRPNASGGYVSQLSTSAYIVDKVVPSTVNVVMDNSRRWARTWQFPTNTPATVFGPLTVEDESSDIAVFISDISYGTPLNNAHSATHPAETSADTAGPSPKRRALFRGNSSTPSKTSTRYLTSPHTPPAATLTRGDGHPSLMQLSSPDSLPSAARNLRGAAAIEAMNAHSMAELPAVCTFENTQGSSVAAAPIAVPTFVKSQALTSTPAARKPCARKTPVKPTVPRSSRKGKERMVKVPDATSTNNAVALHTTPDMTLD